MKKKESDQQTEKKITSDSQMKATKEWKRNNRDRNRFLSYRSTAFLFARKYASKYDMEELQKVFMEKNPSAQEE